MTDVNEPEVAEGSTRISIDSILYPKVVAAAFWEERSTTEFVNWVLNTYIIKREAERGKPYGSPKRLRGKPAKDKGAAG